MAYIGNRPEQGNFRKCDAITTSATATYNLLVGGVAVNPNQNQCIVSLNGVIQSSGNSYTIASSQITFASALTSSDVIDFILILGDTLDVGVPSDDTVGLAQFSATGSPSSSNFLRGDNSWQTVSGTTINNNADNRVITGSGTANTLEGEANLTFDGNEMTVQGTPVVVGTNSSAVLDLKNTASSADGTAVGIAFSTNTGGSANAHITAVQDANAKGTLNFGGYDGTSTRNNVMSVDAGNNLVKVTSSGTGDSFTVTNSSGAMANDAAAVKINVTDTSDTDNWYGLHILNNGTSKFSITGSGLTTINYLAQNSDVQTNNARSLTTSSDMRLKNDKGLLTDATTKIKQLKPRYFKWKDDVEKNGEDNALQQLGFFSQEVNPILPEAACKVALKDEDGNAILDSEGNQDYSWGLNTRAIVATLVKTVQELEERIKTLENA